MNVVDSSGWLEYFAKGSNGAFFAPVIQDTANLIVPTICIYEVYERILIQKDAEDALNVVGWMSLGQIADVTREIALQAADLSLEHKLPMADSLILAAARAYEAILWTQDEHFNGIEGVRYIKK